jgi:hypothetical protein
LPLQASEHKDITKNGNKFLLKCQKKSS